MVWIEIERTDSKEQNEKNASNYTKLIHKLGMPKYNRVEWNEVRRTYEYIDQAEGFTEMGDEGRYFNLDYLSK